MHMQFQARIFSPRAYWSIALIPTLSVRYWFLYASRYCSVPITGAFPLFLVKWYITSLLNCLHQKNQQIPRSSSVVNTGKLKKETKNKDHPLWFQGFKSRSKLVHTSHTNFINKVLVPVCLLVLLCYVLGSQCITSLLMCWHEKALHVLTQNHIVPSTNTDTSIHGSMSKAYDHIEINNLTRQNDF